MSKNQAQLNIFKLFSAAIICCLISVASFAINIEIEIPELDSQNRQSKTNPGSCVNTDFFSSPEEYDDERVWNLATKISQLVIRFPGGMANWYNWESGNINQNGKAVFDFMKGEDFKSVSLEKIAGIVSEKDVGVLFPVNIYEESNEKVKIVKMLLKNHVDLRGVEIGNELYDPLFAIDVGGAKGYLQKGRHTLEILRESGYKGPVGINLAPEWGPSIRKHVYFKHFKAWNAYMRDDGLSDFDAVIVHYYPVLKDTDFSITASHAVNGLRAMISDIRGLFPNKQIWLSEWNLGSANNKHLHTLGHALFVADMLQVIYEKEVDLACYHLLTGRAWELLGPNKFTLNNNHETGTNVIRRIPYFSLLLHSQAATGHFLKSGSNRGIHYMLFKEGDVINALVWSRKSLTDSINVIMNGKALDFDNAVVINGKLSSSNGSLLGYLENPDQSDYENITPVLKKSNIIKYPAIGLYHFRIN